MAIWSLHTLLEQSTCYLLPGYLLRTLSSVPLCGWGRSCLEAIAKSAKPRGRRLSRSLSYSSPLKIHPLLFSRVFRKCQTVPVQQWRLPAAGSRQLLHRQDRWPVFEKTIVGPASFLLPSGWQTGCTLYPQQTGAGGQATCFLVKSLFGDKIPGRKAWR